MLPLILSAALSAAAGAQASDIETSALTAELRAKDEALLTAVHRGNKAAWAAMTTPDFAYVEEGEIQRRAEFLESLVSDSLDPLVIIDYAVQRIGDTAIVIHQDAVPADPLDSRPGGRYLMTETWQHVDGDWKLRLVHIEAIRTDPPAVLLSHAQIDELVGTYQNKAGKSFVIRRDGNRILGVRAGRPDVELLAETRDVLFAPGVTRLRRIFLRDAAGDVTGFVNRDENSDVVYTKIIPNAQPNSAKKQNSKTARRLETSRHK